LKIDAEISKVKEEPCPVLESQKSIKLQLNVEPRLCQVEICLEKLEKTRDEPKWRSERIRKALLRHFKRYYMTSFDRYVKAKSSQSKLHVETVDLLKIANQYLIDRGLSLPEP
jgi:hypothetical protein